MKALAGDFNQDFHDYKPLWMDLRFKLYSSLVCRISLYLAGLLYSFIGVFIVADIFMCSIDSITSTTKKAWSSLSMFMVKSIIFSKSKSKAVSCLDF